MSIAVMAVPPLCPAALCQRLLHASLIHGGVECLLRSLAALYLILHFFGQNAFGIIDPEGGALEMIVHDKSEGGVGGPLNQFSTIGYKFETNGATILYPERMLRVMSVSEFSATDEVN